MITSTIMQVLLSKSISPIRYNIPEKENRYKINQVPRSNKYYAVPLDGQAVEVHPVFYKNPCLVLAFKTFKNHPLVEMSKNIAWIDAEGYGHTDTINNVPKYVLQQAQHGRVFKKVAKSREKIFFIEKGIQIVPLEGRDDQYAFSNAHSYFIQATESDIPIDYLENGE